MSEEDYKLYLLAEIYYKKNHKDLSDDELFPLGWYSINDYKIKTEIIGEALKNNKKIEETEKYQNIQEGIVKDSH